VLEKDPRMIDAIEETQLHPQEGSRATIFPFLNTDSVASRYPPRIIPSGMINTTIKAIIHSILVFLCGVAATLEMTTPELVRRPSFY
jgi:hypothetical protein